MHEGTSPVERMLHAADRRDPKASRELLPLVYDELRRLARSRMAKLPPGNTLQPTALVHEAYLRLAGKPHTQASWNHMGHFFGAAAEAMRQILVDQARRKSARKRGAGMTRLDVDDHEIPIHPPADDVLALNDALERLQKDDERKARIVLLRHFAGLTRDETAAAMGLSPRTIDREWRYILARFHKEISGDSTDRRPGRNRG
ncbi:MAG TPA: ECF-type sigma factor [bacterium]|nr:ECF-type sigma factor [bacterium]